MTSFIIDEREIPENGEHVGVMLFVSTRWDNVECLKGNTELSTKCILRRNIQAWQSKKPELELI